jgi:hypothetical protein
VTAEINRSRLYLETCTRKVLNNADGGLFANRKNPIM